MSQFSFFYLIHGLISSPLELSIRCSTSWRQAGVHWMRPDACRNVVFSAFELNAGTERRRRAETGCDRKGTCVAGASLEM